MIPSYDVIKWLKKNGLSFQKIFSHDYCRKFKMKFISFDREMFKLDSLIFSLFYLLIFNPNHMNLFETEMVGSMYVPHMIFRQFSSYHGRLRMTIETNV
jgi:membrane-anchored glycerophosphoryl diester phosphodiesterase (GDPDase)